MEQRTSREATNAYDGLGIGKGRHWQAWEGAERVSGCGMSILRWSAKGRFVEPDASSLEWSICVTRAGTYLPLITIARASPYPNSYMTLKADIPIPCLGV